MRSLSLLSVYAVLLTATVDAGWPFGKATTTITTTTILTTTRKPIYTIIPHVPCIPFFDKRPRCTTTTPVPRAFPSFETGVIEALGFQVSDVTSCISNANSSVGELWEAAKFYRKGNWVDKAKALIKIGHAVELVTKSLHPCSAALSYASNYKKMMKYLQDPRYYTGHNALTLALNLAEDHKELGTFKIAWEEEDFHVAGFDLTKVIMDVLANPGIPSSNGTTAARISQGLALGFEEDVDLECFKDVRVEIPALIGGVLDIMSVVGMVNGLESLFVGLKGIVPAYKQCMADRPKIRNMLQTCGDFVHPKELAKTFGKHIHDNRLDLGLETAAALLDYKGGVWKRLGQDIGQILQKIIFGLSTVDVVV